MKKNDIYHKKIDTIISIYLNKILLIINGSNKKEQCRSRFAFEILVTLDIYDLAYIDNNVKLITKKPEIKYIINHIFYYLYTGIDCDKISVKSNDIFLNSFLETINDFSETIFSLYENKKETIERGEKFPLYMFDQYFPTTAIPSTKKTIPSNQLSVFVNVNDLYKYDTYHIVRDFIGDIKFEYDNYIFDSIMQKKKSLTNNTNTNTNIYNNEKHDDINDESYEHFKKTKNNNEVYIIATIFSTFIFTIGLYNNSFITEIVAILLWFYIRYKFIIE
ncbi:hypothetical protein [Providencia manganoxydans]|uniref:hypothetical protein n=1 Tax=Providencia manganoxydans TaxID=2923283 RepID=UPI0034DD763B